MGVILHRHYGGLHHKSWTALVLTLTLVSEGSPRQETLESFFRVVYRGYRGTEALD